MAQKNIRRPGFEVPGTTWKAWAVAHKNMGIERNFRLLSEKCKKMMNDHGGVVNMVP